MPCPILCPVECLRPSRMPFTRVRMGVLDQWLHAIRALTLQILLTLFFSSGTMPLQRHVSNWKPVLWDREKQTERPALRTAQAKKKKSSCKLRAFYPVLTEVFQQLQNIRAKGKQILEENTNNTQRTFLVLVDCAGLKVIGNNVGQVPLDEKCYGFDFK